MAAKEKFTEEKNNLPIYKDDTAKTNGGDKKFNSPPDEHKKRTYNIEQNENPHHFICDGIKVRVSYEGTADLNELIKGLFLAG